MTWKETPIDDGLSEGEVQKGKEFAAAMKGLLKTTQGKETAEDIQEMEAYTTNQSDNSRTS